MGFCRTNLFKRLESNGAVFLQSIERHILRNYIFLHAIENGLLLPLGTQGAELLDTRVNDEDSEDKTGELFDDENDESGNGTNQEGPSGLRTEAEFKARAAEVDTTM